MLEHLTALILSVWVAMHAPQDVSVARGAASAIAEDGARGYVDLDLEAAVLAVYIAHESSVRMLPQPIAWDARSGRSCGLLQLGCERVRGRSAREQVALWLRDVHASSLADVDSDPVRAERRLALAVTLLAQR